MNNPFKKFFSRAKLASAGVSVESPTVAPESVEDKKIVETTYDNMGDYWEAIGLNKDGDVVTRERLNANPGDRESLEMEYRTFRRQAGLKDDPEIPDFNM